MESALGKLSADIERLRERILRKENKAVEVVFSGISAGKTYDGTTNIELDLSGVVYRNAATGAEIDPDFSKNFRLCFAALTLPAKDAGIYTLAIVLESFEGGGEFYLLAESGSQTTVEAEVRRATLTVSVGKDGKTEYSGFVGGEDESVLSGELKIEYTEQNGKRIAIPSGLSSKNYDIVFRPTEVEGTNLGLILGICIPVAVILAVSVGVAVFIIRKKRTS